MEYIYNHHQYIYNHRSTYKSPMDIDVLVIYHNLCSTYTYHVVIRNHL